MVSFWEDSWCFSPWKSCFLEINLLKFWIGVSLQGCKTLGSILFGMSKKKIQTQVKTFVNPISVPGQRFSHIHVDLVGPFPQSSGFSHLFTILDRMTRWPEAVPLSSTTAEDCAWVLIWCWVSLFGVPSLITSDRGAQFPSSIWSSMCRFLGIVHSTTTSFYPQSNGLV